MTNWLAATPQERVLQVISDGPSGDGWRDHQRATVSEGLCPVCLNPLGGPGPASGYAVAAGNCETAGCPASPCRWAISIPQPVTGLGALMWAPLALLPGH